MNKDDLAKSVYEAHGGMSYLDARRVVDLILTIVKDHLSQGERVVISGFGSFRVVTRKDRKGVNPQTGKDIVIRGRKSISFKPSKFLKSI